MSNIKMICPKCRKKSIFYDKADIDIKDMINHYKKEIKRLKKEKGL